MQDCKFLFSSLFTASVRLVDGDVGLVVALKIKVRIEAFFAYFKYGETMETIIMG